MHPLLLCAIFSLISVTTSQDRSPHGLAHENPMAFSPSAFEFFHPDNHQPSKVNPCAASGCSPLPIAATVQSSLAYASRSTQNRGGSGIRAGGIAGIIFGFVFVVLLAMGVYYVVIKHATNMSKIILLKLKLDTLPVVSLAIQKTTAMAVLLSILIGDVFMIVISNRG